jgi:uncharacterized protein YbaA (DUF1428 family)
MTYIDGMMCAVKTELKGEYLSYAEKTSVLFREFGATGIVENWGDDVPDGKVTSFPLAVQKVEGETVVLSWVKWPSKAVRDAGWKALEESGRLQSLGEMPFDGQRMIFGGFETVLEQ